MSSNSACELTDKLDASAEPHSRLSALSQWNLPQWGDMPSESTASALELITATCHLLSGTLCPADSDPVHWH